MSAMPSGNIPPDPPRIPSVMARRLVVLALAAAAAAAAVAAAHRRRTAADPARNGGSRERAVRLQRELGQARERLRADIVRAREQQ
jgi:hypothetical protein